MSNCFALREDDLAACVYLACSGAEAVSVAHQQKLPTTCDVVAAMLDSIRRCLALKTLLRIWGTVIANTLLFVCRETVFCMTFFLLSLMSELAAACKARESPRGMP